MRGDRGGGAASRRVERLLRRVPDRPRRSEPSAYLDYDARLLVRECRELDQGLRRTARRERRVARQHRAEAAAVDALVRNGLLHQRAIDPTDHRLAARAAAI